MIRSAFNQSLRPLLKQYSTTVKIVETDVVERSVNRVTLLGRVGRNAEVMGSEANPVTIFSMATSETFRVKKEDQPDELRQRTSWHRVNIFKPGLRDAVSTYCKKGSRVLVFGRLSYSSYINDQNQKILSTNIIADDVVFVGGNTKSNSGNTSDVSLDESDLLHEH